MRRLLAPNVLDILSARRVPEEVMAALRLVAPEEPIVISDEQARGLLGPLLWMCDRTHGSGLQLTATGRLKPADVTALMTELGWSSWWIGKANREDLTQPAQWLRETATRVGVVRKYKGRLLLTRLGARLHSHPAAGLMAIAERLPVETDTASEVAGTLVLLDQLSAAAEAEEEQPSVALGSSPAHANVEDGASDELAP